MEFRYNLPFPLELNARVALGVSLWKNGSIQSLISELDFVDYENKLLDKWKEIENKVLANAKLLPLPESILLKLLSIIEPIGLEVAIWMVFHRKHCSIVCDLPKEFCWTSQGTIDRKRTAEMLIRDQSIDIRTRFEIASIYCLETDILILWEKLKESCEEYVKSVKDHKSSLVRYWNCQLVKEDILICNLFSSSDIRLRDFEYGFKFHDICRNEIAVNFLLEKFCREERNLILMDTARCLTRELIHTREPVVFMSYLSNTLLFLFCRMNEDQRLVLWRETEYKYDNAAYVILRGFLYWPLQGLFKKMTHNICKYLYQEDYLSILSDILRKIITWNDYNYEELYCIFWNEVPKHYRSFLIYVMLDEWSYRIISDRGFRILLDQLTRTEKNQIIFNIDQVMIFSSDAKDNNSFDLVEILFRKCVTSNDTVAELKSIVREYTLLAEEEPVRYKLLELLDDICKEMAIS